MVSIKKLNKTIETALMLDYSDNSVILRNLYERATEVFFSYNGNFKIIEESTGTKVILPEDLIKLRDNLEVLSLSLELISPRTYVA